MRNKIGINADSFTINGDLKILEKFLRCFEETGFTHAEIPIHGLDCIVNGSLSLNRLETVKSTLRKFPLSYTVHSPDHLDLANTDYPETHQTSLEATIDFASEISASLVVYHGSSCWVCDQETERLGTIANYAALRGVKVAVENIFRQYPGEISYRIDPRTLASQIAKIDSPALGICFDFGHAFISAQEEKFDYLEAFKAVLPRLVHVHIHDNFGKPAIPGTRTLDALFQGIGDLHLPPGEAAIPYDSLFQLFPPDYAGVYMMEIQPRFMSEYGNSLDWMRHMAYSKEFCA